VGKAKGPYRAEFPAGSAVQVIDRVPLERFRETWRYHHPLSESQLRFAGLTAVVDSVSFYHGGDESYELKGLEGIWHEECLEPVRGGMDHLPFDDASGLS
jgi:hypothetical protein